MVSSSSIKFTSGLKYTIILLILSIKADINQSNTVRIAKVDGSLSRQHLRVTL